MQILIKYIIGKFAKRGVYYLDFNQLILHSFMFNDIRESARNKYVGYDKSENRYILLRKYYDDYTAIDYNCIFKFPALWNEKKSISIEKDKLIYHNLTKRIKLILEPSVDHLRNYWTDYYHNCFKKYITEDAPELIGWYESIYFKKLMKILPHYFDRISTFHNIYCRYLAKYRDQICGS